MTAGFSNEFKEQVRSRTDVVELIGESISLQSKRGGREFVGLCPFHDDHNPSFTVSPERQSYKCWVCDEGGDCFSYVMKIENVDFRTALEMLARRANLEMPKSYRRGPQQNGDQKVRLYEILDWATRQFHRCLLSSSEAERARQYLAGRGFEDHTIAEFQIGYHPLGWEWLQQLARGKYSPQDLLAARLVRERDSGNGFYDDFRDRVLFPIRDQRGRPVAFGGRILPDNDRPDAPKYLNSPESEVFSKSRLLYGFDAARQAIRATGAAVVVEGYTDCIVAHQYGVKNVVGTLGTSLTENHVILLKRLARKVILVYDGDQAGQMAAERAMAQFLAQEVDLRILSLPAGKDPADTLADEGAEAFGRRLDQAIEAWQFKLQAAIRRYGLGSVDARQRVLDEMLELLAQVPRLSGSIREDIILGRLAERVGIDELTVRQRLREIRKKKSKPNSAVQTAQPSGGPDQAKPFSIGTDKDDLLESELLEILFVAPQTIERIRTEVGADDFRNPEFAKLFQLCLDLADQDGAPDVGRVMSAVEDTGQKALVAELESRARQKQTENLLARDAGILNHTLEGLKWRRKEESHEVLKGQAAQVSGGLLDQDAKAMLRRWHEFHQERAKKKTSI